jgi:thiol-disulfide isomerase/thioredoxin
MIRVAIVTLFLLWSGGVAHAQLRIGDPARALKDVDYAGKVTLVDFFTTWCEPCHEAMRTLDKLARKPGVQLVVVDVGEEPEAVNAWFAKHPLPPGAKVVLDPDEAVSRSWGQRRLPTTFVIDAGGVVRQINRGYGPGYPARVQGWVREVQTANDRARPADGEAKEK